MAGMLIIGSGPSGAGKNSVFNEVIRQQEGRVVESVSCTTRASRPGEIDGLDYYFISLEQFEQWERQGHFLEAVGNHNSKRYGTPVQPVLDKLAQGIDVLLVIEVNGARLARKRMPDALAIFIMPDGDTVQQRSHQLQTQLNKRGTDTAEMIEDRLKIATREMDQAKDYHHVVVNAPGRLEAAVSEVIALIEQARAERLANSVYRIV